MLDLMTCTISFTTWSLLLDARLLRVKIYRGCDLLKEIHMYAVDL